MVALEPESNVALNLKFLGDPLVALGIAVLSATVCLGWANGLSRDHVGAILRKSLAPMMAGLAPVQASLIALVIGAGSAFFCHVNDAGFWMIREYFGLQLKQTLWVWSVLQTIVSVVGLIGTLLVWHWLA